MLIFLLYIIYFFFIFFICLKKIVNYCFIRVNFFVFFFKFLAGLKRELNLILDRNLIFEMISFYVIIYAILYFILYQAFKGIVYVKVFDNFIGNLFLDFYVIEMIIFFIINFLDSITWFHFDYEQNELKDLNEFNYIAFRLFFKNYRSWRFIKFLWINEKIHLILPTTDALILVPVENWNKLSFIDILKNFSILKYNLFFYKFKYYINYINYFSDHLQFQKLCCLNNVFFNQFFFIKD